MPLRDHGRFAQAFAVRLIAGMAVCCASACSPTASTSPPTESGPVTLTVGIPTAAGLDARYGLAQAAALTTLEGLSRQSLNGRLIPRLAERWAEAPDGKSWTIWLRRNAVFHDGTPVDARAVKSSLERSLKDSSGRFAPALQDITSIEAADAYVVTIRLRQRSTLLPDYLDTPITTVDASGLRIGTGPYVVTSSSPTEMVMAAFPKYYRAEPTIKRLVWKLYPTARTAWAATMRGEVDFLYEVGPDSREFLQLERSIEVHPFLRSYVYGLVFNSKRPFFREPRVRSALNYAVDRKAIVDRAFRGHATVAHGPAWPLHWTQTSAGPVFAYDPGRAAASLQETSPRDGAPRSRMVNLKFVCLIPQNFALWERLALMVQRDLAEIGVEMDLESVPFETFNQRIAEGTFDAVLTEMISGYTGSRPFYFWHSTSPSNSFGYRNMTVDASFDGMQRASSEDEYRQAFHRFQQAIFDDPPAIFLAWGQTARAVGRRFHAVRPESGDIRTTIGDWTLADSSARAAN